MCGQSALTVPLLNKLWFSPHELLVVLQYLDDVTWKSVEKRKRKKRGEVWLIYKGSKYDLQFHNQVDGSLAFVGFEKFDHVRMVQPTTTYDKNYKH